MARAKEYTRVVQWFPDQTKWINMSGRVSSGTESPPREQEYSRMAMCFLTIHLPYHTGKNISSSLSDFLARVKEYTQVVQWLRDQSKGIHSSGAMITWPEKRNTLEWCSDFLARVNEYTRVVQCLPGQSKGICSSGEVISWPEYRNTLEWCSDFLARVKEYTRVVQWLPGQSKGIH